METIVAIDLGKNKSVVYKMDRRSLKTQYQLSVWVWRVLRGYEWKAAGEMDYA